MLTPMRIWIDDVREPPFEWKSSWLVWAKTTEQAIEAVERCRVFGIPISHISFDHDLGNGDDSRPVVLHMIENDIHAQHYDVHSANPPGAEWLEGMINRYLR